MLSILIDRWHLNVNLKYWRKLFWKLFLKLLICTKVPLVYDNANHSSFELPLFTGLTVISCRNCCSIWSCTKLMQLPYHTSDWSYFKALLTLRLPSTTIVPYANSLDLDETPKKIGVSPKSKLFDTQTIFLPTFEWYRSTLKSEADGKLADENLFGGPRLKHYAIFLIKPRTNMSIKGAESRNDIALLYALPLLIVPVRHC